MKLINHKIMYVEHIEHYIYDRDYYIRGYCVYQMIWNAMIGKRLACERELLNNKDRYVVVVEKTGVIVRYLAS